MKQYAFYNRITSDPKTQLDWKWKDREKIFHKIVAEKRAKLAIWLSEKIGS
jgi:hypothetical protein